MCRPRSSILALVVSCLPGRAGLSAEAADTAKAPPKLQAAVARLAAALPGWPVHQIDQEPSVAVDGQRGYRIVLRFTWKEPPAGSPPQQQVAAPRPGGDDPAYVTRHTDWHFVLVPASDAKLAAEAKREILWHVPDEKQYRLPVALGEGHGFVWFSYATIPMQHFVREQLRLTGGDDRLQLALRGLSVEDEGMTTRNSVAGLFVQFGDEGFAALDEVVRASDDPSNAVRSMVHFRDAKATARLAELYNSHNKQIHRAAAYALINKPFRPAAKTAYFDMIGRRLHVNEAMQACQELGWKDALPLIEGVVERPSSLGAYRDAYQIYRQLSGKPIDAEVLAAAKVIQRQSGSDRASRPTEGELAAARRTILASADVEGAAFVGFSLATFITKGNTAPVNKDGIEMLRALPRPVVEKMLSRLLDGLGDTDRPPVLKVLRQVS
jgi:hypothetical protein